MAEAHMTDSDRRFHIGLQPIWRSQDGTPPADRVTMAGAEGPLERV